MENTLPTLQDVARRAGVSPATVSRVMNKTAPVNPHTVARVRAAIEALSYEPLSRPTTGNGSKSKIAAGDARVPPSPLPEPSGMIALVITDILNPFFPEIVRGVEDDSGVDGHLLLLYNTREDPRRERHALSLFSEQHVKGIIVCASRLPEADLIALHRLNRTPLVVLNRRIEYPGIHSILVDEENAAYRATQHLLRLGHRRIAFLAGYSSFAASQARRRGVEAALAEQGLMLRADWLIHSSIGIEGGFQAMSALLSRGGGESDRPTGIVAYNDQIALGALHAIRLCGLSVPEDISVVGFDGIAMAAHFNPPLTTIDQPKYRMGQLAMQMIRRILAGDHPPEGGYTLMESPLVVRESTAPPREQEQRLSS